MTEIERKALALVNEARSLCRTSILSDKMARDLANELERAIEQHEAFRQEVSDAVVAAKAYYEVPMYDLSAFIIAKPDPLVEVWEDMLRDSKPGEDRLEVFRAALAARGLKIVEDK